MNIKEELRMDMMEESRIEHLLHTNEKYCIEHHGLEDIYDELVKISNHVSGYGHEVSVETLLNYLKDM